MRKILDDLIRKAKENYKHIGNVVCPAFNNEKILFNQKGFRHLIMKGGKYRTHGQQIRRLSLIPKIISVISTSSKIHSYRNDFGIEFWSLSKIIDNILIVVVIRQSSKNQSKYFLSVMDKKLSKNAKTP